MAHLFKLGLENFRVFKDFTEIEFAPITIFTGTNNSGKSSVVKAIQLLKNNLTTPDSDSDLILSFISGEHKISSFNDVVNDQSKPLKFVIPTVLKGNDEILTITLTYISNKSNDSGDGIIRCIELHNENKKLIFKYDVIDSEPKVYTDYKYFYSKLLDLINKSSYYNIIKLKESERKINFYPYPLLKNYAEGTFLGNASAKPETTKPLFSKSGLINPELLLLLLIHEGKIDLELWTAKYSNSYFNESNKEKIIYSYLNIEANMATKEIDSLKNKLELNLLDNLNATKIGISEGSPFRSQFKHHIGDFYPYQENIKNKFIKTIFQGIPIEKREKLFGGIYSEGVDSPSETNLEFFLQDYISKNIS